MNVSAQCKALEISRSSVYYKKRHNMMEKDLVVLGHIKTVLERLPFYGYRKVYRQLCAQGYCVTEKQVQRIMARSGLQAIYPGKNLSKARMEHKKYPYLLAGKQIRYPNQVWATDLTYLKTAGGNMYLMVIIDVYSRKVLNWIITNTLDAPIFTGCLKETIERYGCPAIFNSDQGCQFTSDCWTNVLHEYGIRISMDGKKRALDNIYIERLWRSLKYEDIYLNRYESVSSLKEGVARYFRFYNTERFHQGIDYRFPDDMYESFQVVDLNKKAA